MDYRKLTHIPQKWLHRLMETPRLSLLGAAASLPLFGMVTTVAIASSQPSPDDIADVQVRQITERLALPAFQATQSTTRYWREEPIRRGDTLGRLLNRLGVNDADAHQFLYSSPLSKPLLRLKTGATLSVETNDAGELFGLRFVNDDENGEKVLVVIAKENGQWQASADPVQTQTIQTVRSAQVRTGATGAMAQAGIPVEVRAQLADIFSDRFDLDELKKGDRISLVYETLLYNGSPLTTGNLLGAEIVKDGIAHQAFYFARDSESGSYYDLAGKPLKKGFSQQPVANSRISSGYGMRFHPILRTLRMHQGIDYAAGRGTPILAPADGTVITAETQSGYGNVVELRHNGKMTTLYAHMDGFAKGLKVGQKLKAGELIGYVGSTGRSTGPHLHMEMRIAGQPVDPASTALPMPTLTAAQLKGFQGKSHKLAANLKLLRELPTTVAQLD